MRTLSGRTVALLESRKSDELAAMVQRLGGLPVCAPAVWERPTTMDAGPILDRVIAGQLPVAIVLTGAGAAALLVEADRRGVSSEVRQAMSGMTLVCRGPKPLTVLKQHGLSASIVTAKPHTTRELLDALSGTSLDGVPTLLLHYGERNEPFTESLRARGALVEDVCLYEWALPENVEPLRTLVGDAIAGRIDVMLFTSQVQFRFLFQIAAEMEAVPALRQVLSDRIVVGAVGPVCAAALREGGVVVDVLPASPHSASLVGAVADYFDLFEPPPAE